MSTELHFRTLAEAALAIRTGELSPVDYMEALLHRIEQEDTNLKAFITVTADQAMEDAKQAEIEITGGNYLGPLHGIPYGIKDIIDVAGVPTTANSHALSNYVPSEDATVVKRLRGAGAIVLGKTITHEFAHGGPDLELPYGPARNPWNLERITGGSSAGSASAVASGMLPAALGTDTGGSIRTTAGLCGIVGLKPTYGLVSRYGVLPNSFSFDHIGPMAWTVKDCALILQVLAGHDPKDPASARAQVPDYAAALKPDIKGLRIGIVRNFFEEDFPTSDAQNAALSEAFKVFADLGAKLTDVRVRSLQEYRGVKLVIAESETLSVHLSDLANKLEKYGADFRRRILPACLFSSLDYVNAQRARRRMQVEIDEIYENVDVLVTLGAGPASKIEDHGLSSPWTSKMLTTPFNLFGGPAMSICTGFDENGLPMSMQVAARTFDEATVLRVAHAYEHATLWRDNRPASASKETPLEIVPKYKGVQVPEIDGDYRRHCERAAEDAGLRLSGEHMAEFLEGVLEAKAIRDHLENEFSYHEEPSNTLALSESG